MIAFEPEGEFSSYTAEVMSGNWLDDIRIRQQARFEAAMEEFNRANPIVFEEQEAKEPVFKYLRKPNSEFFGDNKKPA
ncbi:MAG: hypothetical protein ACRCZO_16270 [Cetobacterium sp.]